MPMVRSDDGKVRMLCPNKVADPSSAHEVARQTGTFRTVASLPFAIGGASEQVVPLAMFYCRTCGAVEFYMAEACEPPKGKG